MTRDHAHEHVLASATTVANGLTLGAVLLWSVWPRRRNGRAGSVLLAVGGICVMGVGLRTWVLQPDLHSLLALVQALLQWVAMTLLARATWSTTLPRLVPVVTALGVFVSVAGFVLFLDAVGGGASMDLDLGVSLTERLAFDSLTLWSAVVGVVLLVSDHRPHTDAPPRLWLYPGSKGNENPIGKGIRWRLRAWAPWQDLPERYGPWATAHKRLRKSTMDSIWVLILGYVVINNDAVGESGTCRRRAVRLFP